MKFIRDLGKFFQLGCTIEIGGGFIIIALILWLFGICFIIEHLF